MTTIFIGMKDFRQNLAKYTKKALQNNVKYIVLRKNVPVLEINPVYEKEFALENLKAELDEARDQIEKGEFYTKEEVMAELGLI